MGILDTAKAFARVGAGKGKRAAADAAAKGAHHGTDAASKGAAKLNEAADNLGNDREGGTSQAGERPKDGGAHR